MGDEAKKEIVHSATQRAKAAVTDARDRVKENLQELTDIQTQLKEAKARHEKPAEADVQALEARLKDIQLNMSASVEEAGKEVQQATQEAKQQLAKTDGASPSKGRSASGGSVELERQDTGAQDVIAPAKLTDKYSATSPRPSFTSDAASTQQADEQSGGNTPTSARASQGIVGGFLFRPSSTAGEGDEDDDDEDEDEDAPSADAVTSSIDEATSSAKKASETNRHAVQEAGEDVKDALAKAH